MVPFSVTVCVLLLISNTKAEVSDGQPPNQDPSLMQLSQPFSGYSKALVECDAEWIAFVISFDHDFEGIIYTRGDYHNKESPCFLTAKKGKDFALKFPYNKCGIKFDEREEGFGTTVVVQHDEELTMPGDLAFRFTCLQDKTSKAAIKGIRSQISLVNPDPASDQDMVGYHTSMSASNIAILKPLNMPLPKQRQKEEL